jgi:hypothetical protein
VVVAAAATARRRRRRCNIGRSCFRVGLHFWRTSQKLNTKFPFWTVHFSGVRGLTASSYILFDYTSSGHKRTIADVCNVYIYIQNTYTSIRYIYLFLLH